MKDVISEAKKGKVFKFAGMSPKHADINYCPPCQAKLMSPAEFNWHDGGPPSFGPVAPDRHPMAGADIGVVVPNGKVLRCAVVPEGD